MSLQATTADTGASLTLSMFVPIGTRGTDQWYQIRNTNCTTNMWWVEMGEYRFQFAWMPPYRRRWGCLNHCLARTWDYAPIEEYMEVEPLRFQQWCFRISTDPTYLLTEMAAQTTLFERQNIMGLWEYRQQRTTHIDEFNIYVCNLCGHRLFTGEVAGHSQTLHDGHVDIRLVETFGQRNRDEPLPLLNHAAKKSDYQIALERSEKMLSVWLTPEEYRAYKRNEAIEIQSHKNADIVYIVKKHRQVEIKKKSEEKTLASACLIVPDPTIIENDVLLTKVLLIKNDEDRFLETANISMKHNEQLPPELQVKKVYQQPRRATNAEVDAILARSAA